KSYSFPLAEFKELFPTSFFLDSLDGTGIIPLSYPGITHNLLSNLERFLQNYTSPELTPTDALTGLTADEIKVASDYLGMTLIVVVTDPKYATFGALSLGPKWMRSESISKFYETLLYHALENTYTSLMQY